ncbi:MAG TPA: fumarylacetoacetate hydrolase family protein [Candidatus Thermoplasmatota archaeon]|nr:fumarylacetoacetate hydrolase family protein [Candidatus Thermoplasmatota archaeon]
MKVLCVGRNYARHTREMGVATPESPIWFWKPDSSIVNDGEAVVVPAGIGEVHHEVELALRVGRALRRGTPQEALRHVDAATVAVDVTARDLQAAAKKAGQPWTQSKGYDTFCPLGPWRDLARGDVPDLQAVRLRLSLDGQVRQEGTTADMTWPVAELLALASAWTTLNPGDVLLTGTPEGVGPIRPGMNMEAEAVGIARLRNPVVAG